jgi:hypothetical protein
MSKRVFKAIKCYQYPTGDIEDERGSISYEGERISRTVCFLSFLKNDMSSLIRLSVAICVLS